MNAATMRNVRYLLFLVVVTLSMAYRAESRLAASPAPRPSIAAVPSDLPPGVCTEDCGPSAECSFECWYFPPAPQEGMLITCGEYAGGGSEGMCLGECGDGYCNSYNEEVYDDCTDDCGGCEDDVCQYLYEEYNDECGDCGACEDGTCDPEEEYGDECLDCGYCGDGKCQVLDEASTCSDDCGDLISHDYNECSRFDLDSCENPSLHCTPQQACEPKSNQCASESYCTTSSECCSGEKCFFYSPSTFFGFCMRERIQPRPSERIW